jgi:type VI secretion system secreted protein VgrG
MSESVGPVTLTSTQPDFEFRSMVGTEELSQPFRYDIELLNPSSKVSAEKMLGSGMTVHLVQKDGTLRHFDGVVTDFSLRGSVGENALFAVTLRPWLYLLSQRINCRIFKGTAIQIVKKVFEDYAGVAEFTEGAIEASTDYEFVVQYRESDLNFVMRVLERDGIYFYFKHEAGRHTLVLTDSERLAVEGYSSIEYHPPDKHSEELGERIDDWRSHHVFTTGKFTINDFNFEAPTAPLEARAAVPPAQLIKDLEAYDFPGGYTDVGEGEKIARRRLETLQVPASRFEGHGNVRGVTAGQAFTLEKHPATDFNKEYLVYSAQFQVLSHARESGGIGGGGDVMAATIVALDAAKRFRPVPRTPKPNMTGVQTAIVVGPEGGEIHTDPDGYGMVKVRFHWDRDPDTTGKNSCWVRVSQVWAGPSMGGIFHPRLGQEVIVDFIEGDPDRPLIIGRVYNFENMPPYALTDPNSTQSGIKTRSTPEGTLQNFNEIRFEDKKGAEELFIQAEKTHTTNVKKDRSATVGEADSVSVGGDRSVSVTGNLSVHVGSKGGNYKLDATKAADLIAPDYIELKCKNSVLRLTPDSITLTAGGKASLTVDTRVEAKSMEGHSLLLDPTGAAVTGATVSVTGQALVDVKAVLVKVNS